MLPHADDTVRILELWGFNRAVTIGIKTRNTWVPATWRSPVSGETYRAHKSDKSLIQIINAISLWRQNSWVVSHSALVICSLCHALGCEFEPKWQRSLFWNQAQHLCFLHDSIWFIWFDATICLSNLSCELWNRKSK